MIGEHMKPRQVAHFVSKQQQVGEHLPARVHKPGAHARVAHRVVEPEPQAVQFAQELRVRAARHHLRAESSTNSDYLT